MLIVSRGALVCLFIALVELASLTASNAQELKGPIVPSDDGTMMPPPGEATDSEAEDTGEPVISSAPLEPPPPNVLVQTASDSDAASSNDDSPSRLMPLERELRPLPGVAEVRPEQASDLPEAPDFVTPAGLLPAMSIIPVVHLGPVNLAFGVRYDALFDNNIQLAPHDELSDFEHVVSPRLSLSVGDSLLQKRSFLSLIYEPQLIFFQHYTGYDTVDQQMRLNGQYVSTRAVVRETLDYDHGSDPDRELQGRQSRDLIVNETDATFQASERIAYELDGTAQVRNFQNEINAEEGRLRFWTRYTASPMWTVGAAVAGGGLVPDEGSPQIYEQLWLGAQGQFGPNLSMNLSVGGEVREPQNRDLVVVTPVLEASLQYSPVPDTKLELSAIRQVYNSPDIVNEDYISTKVRVKATQRLWDAFKLCVEAGYENADYVEFQPGVDAPREDNFPYGRVSFSYARYEDLEFGIYYLYQQNFSSQSQLSFSDQQVGMHCRVGF